jgi:hypothetical protein
MRRFEYAFKAEKMRQIFGCDPWDRPMYLAFMVECGGATTAEREEFASLIREKALARWEKIEREALDARAKDWKEHLKKLNHHRERAIELRAAGHFDYANKREEYIAYLEREEPGFLAGINPPSFRGFPPGWDPEGGAA